MPNIKINDLHSTGVDLFNDSESYLNELTDEDLNLTHGGFTKSIKRFANWSSDVCTLTVGSAIIVITEASNNPSE
jgi:hypothetical protein